VVAKVKIHNIKMKCPDCGHMCRLNEDNVGVCQKCDRVWRLKSIGRWVEPIEPMIEDVDTRYCQMSP